MNIEITYICICEEWFRAPCVNIQVLSCEYSDAISSLNSAFVSPSFFSHGVWIVFLDTLVVDLRRQGCLHRTVEIWLLQSCGCARAIDVAKSCTSQPTTLSGGSENTFPSSYFCIKNIILEIQFNILVAV